MYQFSVTRTGQKYSTLPFSETNECGFLSSIIQAIRRPWIEESEALLWQVSTMTDEVFYLSEHKIIFSALKDFLSDKPTDLRAHLENRLKTNHFDQLLCNEVLDKVFGYVDCSDNSAWYLDLMTKYHRRRLMICECHKAKNQMFDMRIDIPDGPMSITV